MRQVREDYRVSIESFAQMVKDYIAKQPAGFRLNFFVDEVGQFIGQNSKLMLNLQTVAETLATVCNGRAWVFVTSQADLEGVLGAFKGMEAQDITKIMGRFKTQLTLASADVREVIQKRLLAKKEEEPEVLTTIYDREKDNLQTLYRFGDNSINLHGWRGSDEFCGFYPFHPYQFDLFQLAIQQLSKHGVFTGKYLSVGERSMLAVFQEVAKAVRNAEVGRLATFDLMYDGIAASIRGDMQTTIKMAERQLGEGIPIRILKALFLLKWVREFKATPRNVAILLIDRPDIDIRAHEKAVREALALLESQSYLQRNGDLFEFLTDTEKDIEVEIKNTEIDESQVADLSPRCSSPMSCVTRRSATKAMDRITLTPESSMTNSSAEKPTSPSMSSRLSIRTTPTPPRSPRKTSARRNCSPFSGRHPLDRSGPALPQDAKIRSAEHRRRR